MSTSTRTVPVDIAQARQVTIRLHGRLVDAGLSVPVRLWDGTNLGPDDAGWRLVLNHPWSLSAMVPTERQRDVSLAVGEAFLADVFDVEGSMVAAMRDLSRLTDQRLGLPDRLGAVSGLRRLPDPPEASGDERAHLDGQLHSRQRDAAAIAFHYDVGNDFYRLFLDRRLVYSCGYFTDDDLEGPVDPDADALDHAQQRKLDLICRKLLLQPGDRLVDIGCGWGALLVHAATHYDATGIGVTLSEQQAELAERRIGEAGLDGQVEVRLADYRDLDGSFDAVASVGMVEHVGAGQLDDYFAHLRQLLRPGGRLLNHGITTGMRADTVLDMADDDSFIGRYVFPDGALVPAWQMLRHLQQAGLAVHDLQQLRPHYARTLAHWIARLETNATQAQRAAGRAAYRTWRAYMAGSAIGFEVGDLGVIQILATRPTDHGPATLPAGRAWMAPTRP